ncbi:uncharacterized protein N7479_010399 [Penicillium vulpinum]|uniref:uncharacterized protein n=1 Tax=Penicillium vulpinum TaxID=29845 RepID=UPI002547E182|nr:uncharacterized protein N7479_010399 [Penicillium vulpinum]KAJ5951986.1 hypothetical protein N7479_010399 [Penicillium vulpinum]
MGVTSLSVSTRKTAETCGGSMGWPRGRLVDAVPASRIDRTSLSVNARKAAGHRSNLSVCELAEGGRACVDFMFSSLKVGIVAMNRTDRTERLCL